jgi:group I intron endonuclease
MIGIYKITSPNNRIYIGKSINIDRRWEEYKNYGCKFQPKLKRSFEKYGVENHIFEVIEECNEELLNEREIYWGEYYNVLDKNGLVLRLGEQGGRKSDESKLKQGMSNKGSKHKPHKQHKPRKDKGQSRGKRSISISEETKQKISIAKKGKTKPKEWGEKQSLLKKGKPNFKIRGNTKKGNKVIQYDLQGNFINEWKNAAEAKKHTGVGNASISMCCRGVNKSAGGFIWKFKVG